MTKVAIHCLAWAVLMGLVGLSGMAMAAGNDEVSQSASSSKPSARPNILFIFSDDHAVNSISAYGSRLKDAAPTPNIDRIAREGALFQNSFCANSICGPSRACILTGKHSHKNGFMKNTGKGFDQSQWTFVKDLHRSGYTTAVIGKWHLKTNPVAFDHWEILPGQGSYYNPDFIQMDGTRKRETGYATDLTTDKAIGWLEGRDRGKPFLLMCQHKAPHRTFAPALRHLGAFKDIEIPEPDSLFDDYANRSETLARNEMSIAQHFRWSYDAKLNESERGGVKLPGYNDKARPEYRRMNAGQKAKWDRHFGPLNRKFMKAYNSGELSTEDVVRWQYRRYMENYLGTVKAVDESVGRLLAYLDENDLADNTIVVYSSDQGFYLGEHGWYDKRWMFEESFKMPFVIRWPGVVAAGSRPEEMIQNIDYAPTFLDAAGLKAPDEVQGRSIVPLLKGDAEGWRTSIYYAYYEFGEHAVPQHFGVRTKSHKLFYLPGTHEWQMFDLDKDPGEMVNVFGDSSYGDLQLELMKEYDRLREVYDAPAYSAHAPKPRR